jgi:DnaJ-class molecular chaperone
MGYALKILGRCGAGGGSLRRLRFETLVPCAFCAGSGEDPKYGGKPASCSVCRGTGQLETVPPVVTCLPCGGSGRGPGDLICLSCRGRGVAPVAPEARICPRCRGTGMDGIFYCNSCKGQGIV